MTPGINRRAALDRGRRLAVTHHRDGTATFHFMEAGGIDLVINLTREECSLIADCTAPPKRSAFDGDDDEHRPRSLRELGPGPV